MAAASVAMREDKSQTVTASFQRYENKIVKHFDLRERLWEGEGETGMTVRAEGRIVEIEQSITAWIKAMETTRPCPSAFHLATYSPARPFAYPSPLRKRPRALPKVSLITESYGQFELISGPDLVDVVTRLPRRFSLVLVLDV